MKIAIPMLLNILFVIVFYLLEKKTKFSKIKNIYKQLIIGCVFGLVAISGSEFGLDITGAKINVRDSGPLSAGLIFGWQAGIISGVIGGGYRALSVLWGAGTYTVVACSISTVLAGVVAALLRKLMFDNKKPTWIYSIGITVVMEVFHMLMIFITNIDDASTAFYFVQKCTIPMTIFNSLTVGLSVLIITLLSKEKIKRVKGKEQIAQTFQKWLVVTILIAFVVTSLFTINLQTGMRKSQIQDTFSSTINDVIADIEEKSDENLLKITREVKDEYLKNSEITLAQLSVKYGVKEINVVDSTGLITDSTEDGLAGLFNMNDTNQSREFMILVNRDKEETFVQDFGPVGSDHETLRKLAGISLPNGGFIQVGYDEKQFHASLDEYVIDFTKNRRVGNSGFIAVCDKDFNLITENYANKKHISFIGIEPNEEMLNKKPASKIYETNIVNEATDYSEKYLYVFTFTEEYCIVAAITDQEAMLLRDASAYLSIFMQVTTFGALFVLLYFLIKKVVIDNILKINNTLSKISNGNLNETVDVRSNIEFASLSDDINTTVDTLKRYIKEAAARIDKELEYAKQIQNSALPHVFPVEHNYEIYANMVAAKEVGGDFYDFYKLDEDSVAFLVADVSGKGIPAAMFMMTAKTIIKDLAERGLEVNDIFTMANEKLCENNESGMFVTAWMGILNTKTGLLTYANAGHNPPLICKDGKYEYLKSRAGFVLAGMEGIKYRVNELQLNKGDKIFLYTDGVTEATNINNEFYGEEKLLNFLNENVSLEPTKLLNNLKQNIDEFVGEAPQFDDITMLIFDYSNKKGADNLIEKEFLAKVESLNEFLGFVEETLESYECSMKTMMAISVALEEVFVNVAKYAYEDKEGKLKFSISFNNETRTIMFVMSDKGIPFNPLNKKDPDITLSAEERQIGGLGIYITKKTMDQVSYSYDNNENVLTMIKKI